MPDTKVTKFQMEGIDQHNRKRLASLPDGFRKIPSGSLCPRDGTEMVSIQKADKKPEALLFPVVCPSCGGTSFKVNV